MFNNLVIIPLAVVGFYQIIRGIASIIEKDIEERQWISGWVVKGYILLTILGCLSLLIAFTNREYENGYDEGYSAGYDIGYVEGSCEAQIEHEEDYSRGFDDGYSEGYWMASIEKEDSIETAIEDAEYQAKEYSGCSPAEALDIIGVYRDPQNPLYADFDITEDEYWQAVNSLHYFYEYLRSEY